MSEINEVIFRWEGEALVVSVCFQSFPPLLLQQSFFHLIFSSFLPSLPTVPNLSPTLPSLCLSALVGLVSGKRKAKSGAMNGSAEGGGKTHMKILFILYKITLCSNQ